MREQEVPGELVPRDVRGPADFAREDPLRSNGPGQQARRLKGKQFDGVASLLYLLTVFKDRQVQFFVITSLIYLTDHPYKLLKLR